ncbi:hypothetical protein KY285_015964 [Solanum tuberosum]|nr:hypothetical protein KY285_015964 [Solanum tuberosum]
MEPPELSLEEWKTVIKMLKAKRLNTNDKMDDPGSLTFDTMATNHITGNPEGLFDQRDIPKCPIGLLDRSNSMATKEGSLMLNDSTWLKDVLYVTNVHHLMCMELIQFVTRVSILLPEIEAVRPGCSGTEALCRLNNEIDKAKTLHQHCSESSKLYLAFTGDTILSRCKKSRNMFEQSLNQVQNMVPVSLAAEISQLIAELRGAIFSVDPSEEEAGKVIKELLHRYVNTTDSAEEYAFEAIQVAMWKLRITSLKALSIEKRSIKEMMDRVGEGETTKRRILSIFLKLLNKHGKSIVTEQTHKENSYPFYNQCEGNSH